MTRYSNQDEVGMYSLECKFATGSSANFVVKMLPLWTHKSQTDHCWRGPHENKRTQSIVFKYDKKCFFCMPIYECDICKCTLRYTNSIPQKKHALKNRATNESEEIYSYLGQLLVCTPQGLRSKCALFLARTFQTMCRQKHSSYFDRNSQVYHTQDMKLLLPLLLLFCG